ncbi:MAG: ATP-binding protein, partial [Flavobacteriaceae bacterium]|nr:ATP-binding protein [Flavobacteriaceae bacterium]
TGQRRVGKSYMLKQIQSYIVKNNPKVHCIFIDKELFEFDSITDYKTLIAYVASNQKKGWNYLFIDEVQEITHFEKALRSLLNQGNFDIYCTGSNAKILSSDIATILGGRQIVIQIHALSYAEFLQFHKKEKTKESLLKYLTYGGLPFLINLPDDATIISEYLKNIYTSILFRDVVLRNSIRDVKFLENLVRFIADNTGSLFSTKSISDYLKSQKINKSVPIINRYLQFLEDAYFINSIKRSDIQGKKIFEVGEKLYFEDLGIRNALTGFNPNDIHKNIENAVLNHLLIAGYKVTVGKNKNKEIDFIATKDNEKIYIQVTYLLKDETTIKREYGNLLEIKDNYPKYVVSFDDFETPNTFEGIKHLVLEKFLLEF